MVKCVYYQSVLSLFSSIFCPLFCLKICLVVLDASSFVTLKASYTACVCGVLSPLNNEDIRLSKLAEVYGSILLLILDSFSSLDRGLLLLIPVMTI